MNTILRISCLIFAFISSISHAVQSDFEQRVVIESERQTIDMKNNIVTYRGDVKVTQGSLQIHADQLQILNANTDGQQILKADGSPATYTQKLENGKLMIAEADSVRYELVSRILLLSGNAKLMQEDSVVKGDRIQYNLEQQLLEANSKQDGSERVTTIFIPEQIQKQLDDDDKKN